MRRDRPRFQRYQDRQRGTRRQILEDALVAERLSLWGDMLDAWEDDALAILTFELLDQRVAALAHRIRLISEALGYPTNWEAVPWSLLILYETVETVWPLGITAQRWDRELIPGEPDPISDDLRMTLKWAADGWLHELEGDPDD